MLTETYGSGVVRRLAAASRPFLERPPSDFVDRPLLSPRGMLHVARADQRAALDQALRAAAEVVPGVRRLDAAGVRELAPLVSAAYADGGLLEPEACAIDVALLHQGYLRGLRRRGGQVIGNAAITAITAVRGGWEVASAAGSWRARGPGRCRRGLGRSDRRARRRAAARAGRQAAHRDPGRSAPRPRPERLADGDRRRRALLRQARGRAAAGLAGGRDPGRALRRPARGARRRARGRPLRDPDRGARPAHPPSLGGAAQLRRRPRSGGRARSRGAGLRLARGPRRLRHHDRAGAGADRRRSDPGR